MSVAELWFWRRGKRLLDFCVHSLNPYGSLLWIWKSQFCKSVKMLGYAFSYRLRWWKEIPCHHGKIERFDERNPRLAKIFRCGRDCLSVLRNLSSYFSGISYEIFHRCLALVDFIVRHIGIINEKADLPAHVSDLVCECLDLLSLSVNVLDLALDADCDSSAFAARQYKLGNIWQVRHNDSSQYRDSRYREKSFPVHTSFSKQIDADNDSVQHNQSTNNFTHGTTSNVVEGICITVIFIAVLIFVYLMMRPHQVAR